MNSVVRKYLLWWLLPVAMVLGSMALLQALLSLRSVSTQILAPQGGVLDIRDAELSQHVAHVVNHWDFYPGALYTAQDFAAGQVGQPAAPEVSASDYPYGTYRLQITAPPNQFYTLCSFSLDYASRVFVNGSEVAVFGRVSDHAADFIPQIGYRTIPLFSGDQGQVEIIYQYSNYVHRDGGYIPPTFLSTPQRMEEFKATNDLTSLTVSGGLLLLGVYFLLNAAVRGKVDFLCLTLCCVVMALRDQNFYILHLCRRKPPGTLPTACSLWW